MSSFHFSSNNLFPAGQALGLMMTSIQFFHQPGVIGNANCLFLVIGSKPLNYCLRLRSSMDGIVFKDSLLHRKIKKAN